MLDHEHFHTTFHFGCVSCEDIIRVLPNFNFFTLDKVKKVHVGNPGFDEMFKIKLTTDFVLMRKEKRKLYLKGEDGVSDMWCQNCGILFWSYNDLRDHILRQHTVSKIFQHKFDQRKYDYNHNILPKTTSSKCHECLRTFASVEKLHIHMEAVHYGQTFDCNACGEIFTRKDNLHRHSVAYHEQDMNSELLRCEECDFTSTRKDNLNRHNAETHGDGDNKFGCTDCGKQFSRKHKLKLHIELKHTERVKRCKFCQEAFCTNRQLNAHLNSKHTFIYCEFCGQEFSKLSNLDRHLRMRASRPKHCKDCGLSMCNMGTLKSLMIMEHNKDK